MNIFNTGYIDLISTGAYSHNLIVNGGDINYLLTGEGNRSDMQGNDANNVTKGNGSTLNTNSRLTEQELKRYKII